jgi:hypothetical protein
MKFLVPLRCIFEPYDAGEFYTVLSRMEIVTWSGKYSTYFHKELKVFPVDIPRRALNLDDVAKEAVCLCNLYIN